eukprot:3419257-Amphidinium_carterae.1
MENGDVLATQIVHMITSTDNPFTSKLHPSKKSTALRYISRKKEAKQRFRPRLNANGSISRGINSVERQCPFRAEVVVAVRLRIENYQYHHLNLFGYLRGLTLQGRGST